MSIKTISHHTKIPHWGIRPARVSKKVYQELKQSEDRGDKDIWQTVIDNLSMQRSIDVCQSRAKDRLCLFYTTVFYPNTLNLEQGGVIKKTWRRLTGQPPVIVTLHRVGRRPLSLVAVKDDFSMDVKIHLSEEIFYRPKKTRKV